MFPLATLACPKVAVVAVQDTHVSTPIADLLDCYLHLHLFECTCTLYKTNEHCICQGLTGENFAPSVIARFLHRVMADLVAGADDLHKFNRYVLPALSEVTVVICMYDNFEGRPNVHLSVVRQARRQDDLGGGCSCIALNFAAD